MSEWRNMDVSSFVFIVDTCIISCHVCMCIYCDIYIYRISKKLGADDNWWVCFVANDSIILPVGFEPI